MRGGREGFWGSVQGVDAPVHGVGLGLRGAFLAEVAAGAAASAVAFFEVSPENYIRRGGASQRHLEAVASEAPILSHGLAMSLGGVDPFDPAFFRDLRAFLARHPWPWYSDHLCWSRHRGIELHDLLPLPFTEATARRVADRLREAEDRLGRRMLIENISYYAPLGGQMTEVEFIGRVLDLSGCGLLLDVNNVFVNAQNHGFDALEWLKQAPLDRVVQLHVAGHERWDDATLIDTHGAAVRGEVEALLAWTIERVGPLPVLLERDHKIPRLPVLLAEVARLQEIYDAALRRYYTREREASV